jgi:hypothetical protein
MPAEPIKYIGDKLVVGPLDYSFLPATPAIPGSAVLNGPVWIGAGGPQLPTANCMIGPGLHPITLQITGITNVIGVVNRSAIANVSGLTTKVGATLRAALSATTGVNIKSSTNVGSSINTFKTVYVETVLDSPVINCQTLNFTTKIFGADIDCASIRAAFGSFASVAAPFKLFDIPHPNKPGMRLKHACIEGPEVGVYYRGRLTGNNVIELPDYWNNLIDPETITVNLTPHTHYQELYVKNIEWGRKINLVNNNGGPIDCSYTVYAERIDVKKLEIEYEE